MKSIIRTILIWLLSLSLTGLPVIAQSQEVADLNQQKNMPMPANDAPVSATQPVAMPCHAKIVLSSKKIVSPPAVQTTVVVKDVTKASSTHNCCCDNDCQCDTACPSVNHSSTTASFQSGLIISSPLNSQLVTESAILYHSCDKDAEKIPPIV